MKNISFLYNLKIGHRIYILVILLLLFIGVIGGVGVYKMTEIGHGMKEIAKRDIPMTKMLEKITVHQLEQAILMEKALRFQGVTAHEEGETFQSVAKHFEELAKKTDKEILEAEEMAMNMINQTRSDKTRKEFEYVLEELKKIEKEHKDYEHHVFDIFKEIEGNKAISPYGPNSSSSDLDRIVVQVEKEQKQLDKHVEGLLFEVSNFTQKAMNKALADEQRGIIIIITFSAIILVLAVALAFVLTRSVTSPLKNLTDAMTELADGKLDAEIPSVRFRDEVYDLSLIHI